MEAMWLPLLVLVAVGVIAWIVRKAPIIDEEVKPIIVWGLLLVGAIVVLKALFDIFKT